MAGVQKYAKEVDGAVYRRSSKLSTDRRRVPILMGRRGRCVPCPASTNRRALDE